MKRSRRRKDSGFALLLVFLMAAVIAITLYLELPRVAFEAQRQKEQLLIDRGEQYKRAIKVFFVANKRYPASIEELESFNNKRSLRKRYIDPMTGKDEWRVIHVQNGVLTDSKVQKPQSAQQQTASTAGQYVGEQNYIGAGTTGTNATGVNIAQRRRASDDRPAGLQDAGAPVVLNPNDPNQANPGGLPGQQPGQMPGQVPAQLPPGAVAGGVPGMPGQMPGTPLGGTRGAPGQINMPYQGGTQSTPGTTGGGGSYVGGGTYVGGGGSYVGGGGSYVGGTPVVGSQPNAPGMPTQLYPGAPVNSQTGGQAPVYGTAPGANGVPPAYGQPGLSTQNQNAAVNLIQNILTTPRPQGSVGGAQGGTTIGGGIAGFASNAEGASIKVYNDRSNFGEWEFIFDLNRDAMPLRNPVTGANGTPASQLGNTQGMGNGGMNPIGSGTGVDPGYGGRGPASQGGGRQQ